MPEKTAFSGGGRSDALGYKIRGNYNLLTKGRKYWLKESGSLQKNKRTHLVSEKEYQSHKGAGMGRA